MRNLLIVLTLLLTGCAAQQVEQQQAPPSETEVLLERGYKNLAHRKTNDAIADFDKAIALCEGQYSSDINKKVYASRGTTETLYYLMKAASDKESAIAVGPTCSDALYLRGYASLDFGEIELAEKYIKRAIAMAPVNAMYLSELGHIYHSKNDWKNALDIFTKAEDAATRFSPEEVKETELSRAKRGVGFTLIELGDLDGAEKKFRECLEINKNDQGASNELGYIESLRKKAP